MEFTVQRQFFDAWERCRRQVGCSLEQTAFLSRVGGLENVRNE